MNYLVFDTETISLNKPFIYNLGYRILSAKGEVLVDRDFVIRQIYDNKPLFATAYYANKRKLYTSKMKAKKALKVSWGEACRVMAKDIKQFNITTAWAYNSDFDEKAFYFNHLFYRNKVRPLDPVQVCDIMDEIDNITDTTEYKEFCKAYGFLTNHKTPRPRKTAEAVFAFITGNPNYCEEHTALEDSKIEAAILLKAHELSWAFGKSAWQTDRGAPARFGQCIKIMLAIKI